jgi:hypothetical protein
VPRGCYPGSFDPLTVAHVAIIDAAFEQCGLTSLDCVLSRVALAKEGGHTESLNERVGALVSLAGDGRPWLQALVTDAQLVADIAAGYDVLVLGADKLAQVVDPSFYGQSRADRDVAVARLPQVIAVAPRGGDVSLDPGLVTRVQQLVLPAWVGDVSSTAVRAGAHQWRAVGPASSEPPALLRGRLGAQTRQSPE